MQANGNPPWGLGIMQNKIPNTDAWHRHAIPAASSPPENFWPFLAVCLTVFCLKFDLGPSPSNEKAYEIRDHHDSGVQSSFERGIYF